MTVHGMIPMDWNRLATTKGTVTIQFRNASFHSSRSSVCNNERAGGAVLTETVLSYRPSRSVRRI